MAESLETRLSHMVEDVFDALKRRETALARRIAESALALGPDHPLSFNAMGLVEESEMNFDAARNWHARAADAQPENAAFRINQAYSMILSGDFGEAERELLKAIEIDPENSNAFQNLAWIRKATAGEPLIDTLESLKRENRGGQQARVLYCYALGKWYDDIGEFDRAFLNFREANELQAIGYGEARSEAYFAEIAAMWSKDFLAARSGAGFNSDKPIFIVGMPRSGSTLIELKLASEPRVAALGERQEIARISVSIEKNHPRRMKYPDWCADLPLQAFAGFGGLYVDQFSAQHPLAERHCLTIARAT